MVARKIRPNVHSVGALDWDRRLFDELIPLPDGTSYNAYLIQGSSKTALVDTVESSKQDELLANLKAAGVKRIDFIVSNHAEPDHSGTLLRILEAHPAAKVATNQNCKNILKDLHGIPDERFTVVADGESLSLGDKTLTFMLAPWVHWPETMFTYLKEDKILFTCDLFGSHLASSDLYAHDEARVYEAAKRYYAEIMMPFRTIIRKHLEKVRGINPQVIAPSHGPVYDKPDFILKAYEDWVGDTVKNEVVIAYVSMWGSTKAMVKHLTGALIERGVTVKLFNLTKTDLGEFAIALVDAATLVIASPTVLAGPHPSAAYAALLANTLRPKTRHAAVIGSYGWSERTVEPLKSMLGNMKVEFLAPVVVRGHPGEEEYAALNRLADEILEKHGKVGITK